MQTVRDQLTFEVEVIDDKELKRRFKDEIHVAEKPELTVSGGQEWRRRGKRKARRPR